METQGIEQFLNLLSSSLWNKQPKQELFSTTVDWDSIFALARDQAVLGLIADGAHRLSPQQQPPMPKLMQVNFLVGRIRSHHALLNKALSDTIHFFSEHDIPTILLKGQGVATYYHDPTLRMCGDIDLYVGVENYERAKQLAAQWSTDSDNATESEKHYHFMHGEVTIELHRVAENLSNRTYNRRFQAWTHEMLQPNKLRTINIADADIQVPPANFEVLYIFNHLFHHFLSSGVGLRQLCDWLLALHTFQAEIDKSALEKNLRNFGLMRGWQKFGCIAVDMLEYPQSEFPFYNSAFKNKADKVMAFILKGGNFGFHDPERTKRPDGYFAGKFHTFRYMCRRSYGLLPLFPKEISSSWLRFISNGVRQVLIDKIKGK